ncbi:MAG: xylulose kinase, partial [Ornithinimicrobium sp.]
GEYVGLGAAKQAAWALAGSEDPPQWPLELASETNASAETEDSDPSELIQRYEALLATMHGQQ